MNETYRKIKIRQLSLLVLNNSKLEVEILEVCKKIIFDIYSRCRFIK